jgi:outer membrane protein TolC
MRRHICTLLLGIISLSSSTIAQSTDFLEVNEAVIRALQQNLSLRIEGVGVLNAREDIVIEESQFDTNIFASASHRGSRSASYGDTIGGVQMHDSLARAGVSKFLNSGSEVQVTTNYLRNRRGGSNAALNPSHASDLSMSLRQPILQGAGIEQNLIPLEQARIDARRSELFLKDTALRIMQAAESAYWSLAYAHQVKKVRTASVEVAEKLLEENRERERVGLATNIDVLQSQVFLSTSEETVIIADALIDNSQDHLFRQMGSIEYPEGYVSVHPLPDLSTEEIGLQTALPTILTNSPNYLQQELNIEVYELFVKSSRNAILPQVDLTAGLGFSGLDNDWPTPMETRWTAMAIIGLQE